MMELDIATAQAIQNNKNGLGPMLRQDGAPDLSIPEYYSMFDVRKPVTKYVEDKLTDLLGEVF